MGTSQSSKGSPSGKPIVPNWVPDSEDPKENPQSDSPDEKEKTADDGGEQTVQVPMAPSGRFKGTRQNLGSYAQTGSSGYMQKGVGHYIRTGLGGTKTAVRRFGGTARTANALYNALSDVSSGKAPPPGSPLDPKILSGKTAQEVMDAVVEAIQPVDGTLDSEASRSSIRDALSELLSKFKDADLLNLKDSERDFVIEQYVALDVFRHFQLDVGKVLQEKAPNAKTSLVRLKEVKNYINPDTPNGTEIFEEICCKKPYFHLYYCQ